MFRSEMANYLVKGGFVSSREIRTLTLDRDANTISELKLLEVENFDDVKFAQYLAGISKINYSDLSGVKVDPSVLKLLSRDQIVRNRAIPIQKLGNETVLAIFDPTVLKSQDGLQKIMKCKVSFTLTNLASWERLYNEIIYSVEDLARNLKVVVADAKDKQGAVGMKAEDIGDEIIFIVNKILVQAYLKKASDIHFEPYQENFRVRIRVDGTLANLVTPPYTLMLAIISRVKIISQMDIAERRKPQDGRIKIEVGDKVIDYRVSSLPTLFGEKIVLRLLDKSNLQLDMTKLGFEKKQLSVFKNGIYKPYGMCLVTGPTGSGKTTTLYSALSELNTSDRNLSTAEDPVEFNLEGINQVNVRKEIGLTFASVLKAFLRQDPDIIMVGEIRDLETGSIAVEAALTGHMVLSTLHTNDAPATISRLLNMGIEPFLIAGALNIVVAQRLCRKICTSCKTSIDFDKNLLISSGISPNYVDRMSVYKGAGCNICNGTGYKGRIAIYEVLEMTSGLREKIVEDVSADDIKRQALKDGMKTLRMSALTKVAMGLTTIEEAVSNSASDK